MRVTVRIDEPAAMRDGTVRRADAWRPQGARSIAWAASLEARPQLISGDYPVGGEIPSRHPADRPRRRMSEFDGLVAVVTGGASGIGAAIAQRLSVAGAEVAVLDLRAAGVPAPQFPRVADVADDASVREAVAAAHERSAASTSSSTTPASARRGTSRRTPTTNGTGCGSSTWSEWLA